MLWSQPPFTELSSNSEIQKFGATFTQMLKEIRTITNPMSACKRLPEWSLQPHTNMTIFIWILKRQPKRYTKPVRENHILLKQGSEKSRSQKRFSFLGHHHRDWISRFLQTVPPSEETRGSGVLSQCRRSLNTASASALAEGVRAWACQTAALSHFKTGFVAFYT